MRNRPWILGAFVLLGPTLAGCGAGPAAPIRVERADSAGIEIVSSRGADQPLPWRIGVVGTLATQNAPVAPEYLATDTAGRLYLLDPARAEVHVYDDGGRHVRTIPGRRAGVGELRMPRALAATPDGTLVLGDALGGRNALIRYAPDGEPLGVVALDVLYQGGRLASSPLRTLLVVADHRTVRPVRRERLIAVTDDGVMHPIAHVDRPTPPLVHYRSCPVALRLEPLFAPPLAWAAGGGSIAVAKDAEYRVDLFRDGVLARSLRRRIEPRRVTYGLALRAAAGHVHDVGGRSCTLDPAEVVEARGHADVVPGVSALAVAPDGTVWVRRGEIEDEDATIDVFAPDGAYRGTLPAGTPFPVAFLDERRFAAVVGDDVVIHEIEHLAVP